jgi:predicted O-methyltransferase YrrM
LLNSTDKDLWSAVDEYLGDTVLGADPVLLAALETSEAAGLPAIQVSPTQGKLLHMLARLQGARSVLEIGTLGGYSTIWLARALPSDGRVLTLEMEPKHAEVARANVARAGLEKTVEVRVGKAMDLLPGIAAEKLGPCDLIFIDADKENNPNYFQWALKLARRGSLIIVDNVVREGAVIEGESTDTAIQGSRRTLQMMGSDPRVTATAIQTVGIKGYDGLAIALVVA